MLLKAQELENSARLIRSRFQKISNTSLQIPVSMLLTKAIVSARNGKNDISADQLEKIVELIVKKNNYILYKPRASDLHCFIFISKQQIFYLNNNFNCVKVQKEEI